MFVGQLNIEKAIRTLYELVAEENGYEIVINSIEKIEDEEKEERSIV